MKKLLILTGLSICLLARPQFAAASPSYYLAPTGSNKLDLSKLAALAPTFGITVKAFANTKEVSPGVFKLPIVGGGFDAADSVIESVSTGGFNISNGTSSITFSAPIVNTIETQPIVTFLVTLDGTLQGRFALLNLASPAPAAVTVAAGDAVKVKPTAATLSDGGASFLNQAFGTTVFTSGTAVGTVTVRAVVGGPIP
jgi:hypothetical protein